MDNYKLIAGDRTIEFTPEALEEFVGTIVNGECGQKLENGTEQVSQLWQELRSLTPAYAGDSGHGN